MCVYICVCIYVCVCVYKVELLFNIYVYICLPVSKMYSHCES